MPEQRNRTFMITLFAVVGCLWFGLHAVEYVGARYAPVGALLPLPAEYGLGGLLVAVPGWASGAIGASVWLGLLGSVLLLLRDKASVIILAVAFLASLVSLIWAGLATTDGMARLGDVLVLPFAASMVGVSFGCWLFARVAKRSGAL